MLPHFQEAIKEGLLHLDGENDASFLSRETAEFVKAPNKFHVVAANAYVGARGIKRALDLGCDIVICECFTKAVVPAHIDVEQAEESQMPARSLALHGGGMAGLKRNTINLLALSLLAT